MKVNLRRPRRTRWAVAAALAIVGTLIALPPAPRVLPAPSWQPARPEARGVFHIHTVRSDGTGTVADVAAAAARDGLRFVILTDHGDGTRRPDPPAYRSGVLCIDAVEISTTGGHYAALALGQTPYPLAGEPRDVADDVRRLGGFGIVTHPLSPKHDLAWRDWSVDFDGIEWLNGDSVWRDAPWPRLALAAWTYAFRPLPTLARLYARPAALARSDDFTAHRRVVLMAGADAHARLGLRRGREPYESGLFLRVPSYRQVLAAASLRVVLPAPLSGDARRDAAAIIGAIRSGHVHTVVDGMAGPAAFEFTAGSGEARAIEGDSLPLDQAATLRVKADTPPGGRIVLYRDGREVDRVASGALTYASNRPGAYRAEVWLDAPRDGAARPWIVGNPIYVGALEPLAAPAPPALGGPVFTAASGGPSWTVERDPRSLGTIERPGDGVGLRYTLAGGGARAPFAALVAGVGGAPGAAGLAFRGSAEAPMRISVQVRVPGAGGGRRWQRSVYLDEFPRDVVVPFQDMRPVEPGDAASRPPAVVGSLLFVVNTLNTRRGSSGAFKVENVRLLSSR